MVNVAYKADESVSSSVMHALRYYSIFQYPLKADEIHGNMPSKCALPDVLVTLDDMVETKCIYKYEGYYSVDPNVKKQVHERKAANELAANKKQQAVRIGKLIYNFPFVRFVGISGSLSKGYADQKSDFDFFIIAQENRLWISRTLLHLFKKLTFLVGQQHKFCMNYFVDTQALEIGEKNCFTAIELSSVIPVRGAELYDKLKDNNLWVNEFLPNGYVGFASGTRIVDDRWQAGKIFLEALLSIMAPSYLNKWLMKLTDAKWRRKWAKRNYPMDEYEIAFKTTLHISKNHPANNQKRILKAIAKLTTQ